MFPGVDPELVNKAVDNKRNIRKPPLPQATATNMDLNGNVSIIFDENIMLPRTIS